MLTFLSSRQLQPIMPLSPASPPTSEALHWNPLVIASMGAVCTIFLLFSYYGILKLHNCSFLGMTFSRHRQQRQLLNDNSPDNPSLPFHSRGLGSYILQSLPIAQFKKNEEELRQSNTDCAVCLGEFEESEWLKHLPNCSHAFHVSCIDAWFQNHSNCPLCRSHVCDLAMQHEYSVSMYTLLETRRENSQNYQHSYQILRSHNLQNSSLGLAPENGN